MNLYIEEKYVNQDPLLALNLEIDRYPALLIKLKHLLVKMLWNSKL